MIVICEECGKKYRIDPSKIKGRAASFKCRLCAHVIMVHKPERSSETTTALPPEPDIDQGDDSSTESAPELPRQAEPSSTAAVPPIVVAAAQRPKSVGLRARMMLLFAFIPLLLR